MSEYQGYLSPIEDIIAEARQGRIFILVDDENRENEGDLVIAGEAVTADSINFMARFGRGLICLALDSDRAGKLGLKPAPNGTRMQTAFTQSIEARDGVTTGISAADRARTIQVAVDPANGADSIVSPGHVFPLVAREGGVLRRPGHTEAAVDIARLAGLNPSGVLCEIMKDDGTMARLPDLIQYAQYHGLKIATIADLIAYRRCREATLARVFDTPLATTWGEGWRLVGYRDTATAKERVALVKGAVGGQTPTLVHLHVADSLRDMLGQSMAHGCGGLAAAMETVASQGTGVVIVAPEPGSGLLDKVEAALQAKPATVSKAEDFVDALVLKDLGVKRMILLADPAREVGAFKEMDLDVVERRPLPQQ